MRKSIVEEIEGLLKSIRDSEYKNNPKASAKALEIKTMITELKMKTNQETFQGLMKYINPKMLLEN
ncbi:MAG: hypothetical protein K2Q18_16010 [Bdellovibrionales bacterium]|nr:hypothetical protein [Bdellovibrionales bacterium]